MIDIGSSMEFGFEDEALPFILKKILRYGTLGSESVLVLVVCVTY